MNVRPLISNQLKAKITVLVISSVVISSMVGCQSSKSDSQVVANEKEVRIDEGSRIQTGSGVIEYKQSILLDNSPMRIFYHAPEGDLSKMPILFVMHGVLRNADVYRDNWVDIANKHQVLVLVPEFSNELFPGGRSYNYGNVFTKDHVLNPENEWSFGLIDPIFYFVANQIDSDQAGYDIFGHSAGSQFVHRFFMLQNNTKANRIVASNAGSYTMLDRDKEFPYGLRGISMSDERIKSILNREIIIQLGEEDIDPAHKNLNVSPEAMEQGRNRFERGHTFYNHAQKLAKDLGVEFKWKLKTVPGVAHENDKMAIAIADYLYP